MIQALFHSEEHSSAKKAYRVVIPRRCDGGVRRACAGTRTLNLARRTVRAGCVRKTDGFHTPPGLDVTSTAHMLCTANDDRSGEPDE